MPNTTIPRVKPNDAGQGLMQQTKTWYYMRRKPNMTNTDYKHKAIIYLACPFASKDDLTVYGRIQSAAQAERRLIGFGACVINPISIGTNSQAQMSNKDWIDYDMNYLRVSDAIFVLKLDGYLTSTGVKKERAYARELDIPEWLISYADLYDDKRMTDLIGMLNEKSALV